MLVAARYDIIVRTSAPFPDDYWQVGADLTGKSIVMQVALYPGAPALLNINSAASSGNRIQMVDAAGGIFRPIISESTLEGLPESGRAGQPSNLSYQISIGTSGIETCWFEGLFIVKPWSD